MPLNTVPHPVDIATGLNMRRLRRLRRMTQENLAEMVGLTFQQIQKYERGANRISCSRLVDIARALGVPPAKLLPEADWEAADTLPQWVEDAEALYFRQPRLFEALLRLSTRQVHGLYMVADSILRPDGPAVE